MLSTSMRKCSAVVCRTAPAWFAAEGLSNVFASVLLVMVILLFFVLRSFSDSIRSISGRIAVPPRGHAAAPTRGNCDVLVSAPRRLKQHRSEERRVGKEWRTRWAPEYEKTEEGA